MTDTDNIAAAFLKLDSIEGLGPAGIKNLIDSSGGIFKLARSSPRTIARAGGVNLAKALKIKKALNEADSFKSRVREIKRQGFRIYCYGEKEYPLPLMQINDPPPILYSKGSLSPVDYNSIAVVGTRKASSYGKKAAELIAKGLSSFNITVVSGAAEGIDTAAHRAALDGGGRTIAVMGGGLNCPYPASNIKLLEEIAARGAVLTEFSPDTRPVPHNFPRRNRIVSALSQGVVVVEAPEKSGALITASFAAEQGRQVYAVPGTIFHAGSRGCFNLIKDGAIPVSGAPEIIEDIGLQLDLDLIKRRQLQFEKELSGYSRKILELLSGGPLNVDIMKNKLKMDISFLVSELTGLELKGRIKKIDGEKYMKVSYE